MNDKPQKSKVKWIEKLKSVKHIEIYITIVFAIILILIFFSSTKDTSATKAKQSSNNTTISSYVDNIETKLEEVLSNINGASDVKVMITLDMSSVNIEDEEIKTSSFPDVKGVVIVAKGVENTMVKMNMLKAVQAVIDISSGRIEILSSNS